MSGTRLYGRFLLVLTLLFAATRPGATQPAQSEKEHKAQLLNAELFLAIHGHQPAEVNAVLARGADPNRRNWLGFTPLMWAANQGNVPIVDILIERHADLEAHSIYGTPLSFALAGRQEEIALHLLEKGVSVHTDRADAATPLMLAACNGEMAVLKRLLSRKDNPNATDSDGATPLIYAARNGQTKAVTALIQAGGGVDVQDSHGRTALMYAAENGQASTVEALLAKRAHVNLMDKGGATALLLAARYSGEASLIRSLLHAGADASLKDGHGATAAGLADTRGYEAAAGALRQSGVRSLQTAPSALTERTSPAVERSLTALQTGMKTFASHVQCASCHHQGLGMMALGTAQQHGFAVDKELVGNMLKQMGEEGQRNGPMVHLALSDPNVAKTIPAMDIRDFSLGVGYMFGGMIANGIPTNPGVQDTAQLLLSQQSPAGNWGHGLERGPMQSSLFNTTALVLQVLHVYGPQEKPEMLADSVNRAKRWLLTTPTSSSEDKSSRLLGLLWAGASKEERAIPLQELLSAQRQDGGWAQTLSLSSDAFATGKALYALHVGGELSTDDPAYRRGVQYLLRTQDEDGSWYVNKLANPANIYFDAGFPHGESQYISFAATCWATMALVQSHEGTQQARR